MNISKKTIITNHVWLFFFNFIKLSPHIENFTIFHIIFFLAYCIYYLVSIDLKKSKLCFHKLLSIYNDIFMIHSHFLINVLCFIIYISLKHCHSMIVHDTYLTKFYNYFPKLCVQLLICYHILYENFLSIALLCKVYLHVHCTELVFELLIDCHKLS